MTYLERHTVPGDVNLQGLVSERLVGGDLQSRDSDRRVRGHVLPAVDGDVEHGAVPATRLVKIGGIDLGETLYQTRE